MSKLLKSPHDNFFKQVFSKKENAIVFFKSFLPAQVTNAIDFDSLKLENASFVTKNLKSYFSDLTYSAEFLNEKGYIYLLFEHKSYKDELVSFQLLKYVIKLYDNYLKQNKGAKKLPVVIPILFYHGEKNLNIDNRFSYLFDSPPDFLLKYIPDFEYVLVDVTKKSEEELKKIKAISLPLLFLKNIFNKDAAKFGKLLEELYRFYNVEKNRDDIIFYLSYIIYGARNIAPEELGKILEQKGGDIMPSLAKKIYDEGRMEGINEGMQKGMQRGMQRGKIDALKEALIDMVEIKFTKITKNILNKIQKTENIEQLVLIKNKLKKAKSLRDFETFLKSL